MSVQDSKTGLTFTPKIVQCNQTRSPYFLCKNIATVLNHTNWSNSSKLYVFGKRKASAKLLNVTWLHMATQRSETAM